MGAPNSRTDLSIREHSILLSVTHMLCINQVCYGVSSCVKDGSCSSSSLEWSQWTVLMRYLAISTNVRRYQTHHRRQLFSFRMIVHRCIVCVTQSNWVKMWFLHFPVLPGSSEAQVTWGGIVRCLWLPTLSVTFLPKKYQNPFMCVKVIASQRWDVFWDRVYNNYCDWWEWCMSNVHVHVIAFLEIHHPMRSCWVCRFHVVTHCNIYITTVGMSEHFRIMKIIYLPAINLICFTNSSFPPHGEAPLYVSDRTCVWSMFKCSAVV